MSLQPLEMDAEEARERVDRVKAAVTQAREDLVSLWRERAWLSLGYASWDELCDAEFGVRMALPREERREVVAELRAEGMSTRAIGSALGVSDTTVVRDLSTASCEAVEPERVTSLDGRQRPATRQAPAERYPELEHYADRPAKAEAIASALDGYDDTEREVRREALAASIAAEQRNGGPVRYVNADPDMDAAHAMYESLSAALRSIERAGPDVFGRVADRLDPLVRISWADTCASLALHVVALSVAIESPKHLRSVQ